jgi:hypothetical protein
MSQYHVFFGVHLKSLFFRHSVANCRQKSRAVKKRGRDLLGRYLQVTFLTLP